MAVTVAIDAMGGDHGPSVTVPAAVDFLHHTQNTQVILVGRPEAIESELEGLNSGAVATRLSIKLASEVVAMDEPPAQAMRSKKDSSMRVAIDLVKHGEADACVSSGNTGALMATARFVLKMLPGIERPAIASTFPTLTGHTLMLDLGANVDCSAEHLLQFAIMGAMLASALDGRENPSIGLLNVGAEEIKGSEVVKQAAELMRAHPHLNFFGNVEGTDIYRGTTDVVVCDGFVGNVVLKTSEGLAQMLATMLRQEVKRNLFTKLLGLAALPIFNAFKQRVDTRQFNGASLLGLRGIVIKSHGSADRCAYEYALKRAVEEVNNGVLARISTEMTALHPEAA